MSIELPAETGMRWMMCVMCLCAAKLRWRLCLVLIERCVKEKTVSSELMPEVCITEYVAIQKLASDGSIQVIHMHTVEKSM